MIFHVGPLTAGADHNRLLHFILAHYISAFKPVKDKKRHESARLKFFDLYFVKSE